MNQDIDNNLALKVISIISFLSLSVNAAVQTFLNGYQVPDLVGFYLFICWLYCLLIASRHCRLAVRSIKIVHLISILVCLIGSLIIYIAKIYSITQAGVFNFDKVILWSVYFLPISICLIWTIRGIDWYQVTPKAYHIINEGNVKFEESIASLYDFNAKKIPWLVPGIITLAGIYIGVSVLVQWDKDISRRLEKERKYQAVLKAEAVRKLEEQEVLRKLAIQAERDRIENEKRTARQEYIDATAEAISEGIKRSRRD